MNHTHFPLNLLPDPENSALLIVDLQERLAAAMPAHLQPAVIRNTVILIETACEFSLPILVSEQYPRGLGPTLPEVRAALPDHILPVEKVVFSCCREPAFNALFESVAGRDIILCGIEAHVCVLQTALDLLANGHRVFIVADAVCSRTEENRFLGLELLRQAGAVIGSTEIIAFGLLRAAGSDRFKRISKLVK